MSTVLNKSLKVLSDFQEMDIKTKYNALAGYESKLHKTGTSYAVHKRLSFRKLNKTYHDINDWLTDKYPLSADEKLLDAGCGIGKTIFTYRLKYPVKATGISLSDIEVKLALAAASSLKVDDDCSFRVQSYDDTFNERFDMIIAIESLKHSKNLFLSIRNLADALTDDGKLIIVEDCLKNDSIKLPFRHLLHRQWALKKFYTLHDYLKGIRASDLLLVESQDFTPAVKYKNKYLAVVLVGLFGLLKRISFSRHIQRVRSIFQAGFAFEYYYSAKQMEYLVLVCQKKKS